MQLSIPATLLAICSLAATSCKDTEITEIENSAAIYIEGANSNKLSSGPQSTLIEQQSKSSINWQPWSSQVFTLAKQEKKTVLAFIGSSTNSYTKLILDDLARSNRTGKQINHNHICTLIDADIYPAQLILAEKLHTLSNQKLSNPIIIWYSHEGLPISWISIQQSQISRVNEMIQQTSHTIDTLWHDSSEYVLHNSRDSIAKLKSYINESQSVEALKASEMNRFARKLLANYDHNTGQIDNLPVYPPSEHLQLVSQLDEKKFPKLQDIAHDTIDQFIYSPMIDPISGGVYTRRLETTWDKPEFAKDLSTQAQTATALINAGQRFDHKRSIQQAKEILDFCDQQLLDPTTNLYKLAINHSVIDYVDSPDLWTADELKNILSEEEFRIISIAFDIRNLGNLPMIDDPRRQLYKQNSLGLRSSLEDIAYKLSIPQDKLNALYTSATKKIAKQKTSHKPDAQTSALVAAGPNIELATAYATLALRTNDELAEKKARELYDQIRQLFVKDNSISQAYFNGEDVGVPANANVYARMVKLALQMYQLTLEPNYLKHAVACQNQMRKNFYDQSISTMTESNSEDSPVPLQFGFNTMPNTRMRPSTHAISYSNLSTLLQLTGDVGYKNELDSVMPKINNSNGHSTAIYIDYLSAYYASQKPCVYFIGALTNDEQKAMHKFAIQSAVKVAKIHPDHPTHFHKQNTAAADIPNTAVVQKNGKTIGVASSLAELKKFLAE